MRNYETKDCQNCGKEYQPTRNAQKYCAECATAMYRTHSANWSQKNPEKVRVVAAKYREENSEKAKVVATKYREENPEKTRAATAKWREENPKKARAATAKWRKENPEYNVQWRKKNLKKSRTSSKASSAKWSKANPDKVKAILARYRKTNPEKMSFYASKRRALKQASTPPNEILTSAEWLTILAEANGHCHYCGKEAKLTMDHIIPLSKGGTHSQNNIAAACAHCNSSKGARTLEEWQRTTAKSL